MPEKLKKSAKNNDIEKIQKNYNTKLEKLDDYNQNLEELDYDISKYNILTTLSFGGGYFLSGSGITGLVCLTYINSSSKTLLIICLGAVVLGLSLNVAAIINAKKFNKKRQTHRNIVRTILKKLNEHAQ